MTVRKVSTSGTKGIGAGTRGSSGCVPLCAHRACALSPGAAIEDAGAEQGRSKSPRADCIRRDFIRAANRGQRRSAQGSQLTWKTGRNGNLGGWQAHKAYLLKKGQLQPMAAKDHDINPNGRSVGRRFGGSRAKVESFRSPEIREHEPKSGPGAQTKARPEGIHSPIRLPFE